MATITDIKKRILELAPAPFQEFCDTLISKNGYGVVHGYGMKSGTGNTTIGNPDTYFRSKSGKYVFVAYTIQQMNIYSKLKEDIDKCLDSNKTGLSISEIEEIICCHTSSNLSAGDDKKLHDYCSRYGIELTIWGLDEIANQVHNQYRSMAKDFLGLSIDTNQIMAIDDFVKLCDENGMSAPLKTKFQSRNEEKAEIINSLEEETAVIITGKAGVGKTRLALEVAKTYSLSKGYKLLCVKNNSLGLFDDLVSATEKPDKYLFFVDDANELAELNLILDYTSKRHQEYVVKIITTVRDYAKSGVIEHIEEYVIPKIFELIPFSDEEIRMFIDDNLGIKNEEYAAHIIRIAEGNPRIAYMAGKLAVENQKISAIKDVSQLYDTYYKKFINRNIGADRDLCFTAGILSVVNAVLLRDITVLQELLNYYGISEIEFKNKIYELSQLEVVEIKLDQVATLSDQCLANYMLYYVFFQRKILPLSRILVLGYKHFRKGVIKSINTILNLFNSEETKSICEQEILTAWDCIKKDDVQIYEEFAKDFHIFRPEEGFLICKKKIERIKREDFDVQSVDYSANIFGQDESCLDFLIGYQYTDYLEYVMELLLDYVSKTQKTTVSGFKWLKNHYGIGISDYKYNYYTQKTISEILIKAIETRDDNKIMFAFQWAKYSLSFSFHPTEMGRGNTFVYYNLEIKKTDGLMQYRKICWDILNAIANNEIWKDKLVLFIDNYAQNLHGKPDKEIVEAERDCLEQLLVSINNGDIRFLKAMKRLLYNAKNVGVIYNKKWSEIFTGKKWELYELLEDDYIYSGLEYDEYEKKRDSDLINYGTNIDISEVSTFVQTSNDILSDSLIGHDSYHMNQGIELIVQQFDEKKLNEFLKSFFVYGKNISIRPSIVLERLHKNVNSVELLEEINKADFPQKNVWQYEYFDSLPDESVTQEMLDGFLEFLSSDSDKNINESSFRQLRVLDKFRDFEPDIYPVASAIIFDKKRYNGFIVEIYFENLFHEQIYSPSELLSLYKNDLQLLEDIYFYMLKKCSFIDYEGSFLMTFLSIGENWLQKYASYFWECGDNHNCRYNKHLTDALWKSNDYKKYFDYIIYHFPEEKLYKWKIAYAFTDVLMHEEKDDLIYKHQKEWIIHIVTENANNDWISIIFDFICELDDDIKRDALKSFLAINSNYETFEKLSLVPKHWSGSDSLVPAFQKQIKFLESLDPILTGVIFLEHRAKIKFEIDQLREMIRREEIEVICSNLYM